MQLERTDEPLHIGDERLAYEVIVENEAGANPAVGDELTCKGAPARCDSGGNPAPVFTIAWLRDGAVVEGATATTYTTVAADEGKTIQCLITGTNDPDGAGADFAPITSSFASLPPVTVERDGGRAERGHAAAADGVAGPGDADGTATATEGSNILTDVVAAEGTGELTNGSPVVKGVTAEHGMFEASQAVRATAPARRGKNARIHKVEEPEPGVLELTLDKSATCLVRRERSKRGRSRSRRSRKSAANASHRGRKC